MITCEEFRRIRSGVPTDFSRGEMAAALRHINVDQCPDCLIFHEEENVRDNDELARLKKLVSEETYKKSIDMGYSLADEFKAKMLADEEAMDIAYGDGK